MEVKVRCSGGSWKECGVAENVEVWTGSLDRMSSGGRALRRHSCSRCLECRRGRMLFLQSV